MADGMNGPGYSVTPAPTAGRDDPKEGPKRGQRDGVIEAVLNAGLSFWRDLDGVAYATVPAQDGCGPQRHRVQSRRFALLVRDLYGQANLRTVGSQGLVIPGSVSDTAMKEVLTALEAIALRGSEREAEVRVCRWQEAVWLDLGGPSWRLVRVDAAGWRVMDGGDPPLIRPEGLRALPIPKPDTESGKVLDSLRGLLNVAPDRPEDFMLLVAWLVAALHPTGPYSVLALDGEQGSGKSTVCRVLRRLIDPSKADLRAPPRSEDDLIVAATAARVVALDNVSIIEADTADAVCRLATGAGLSKRRLYSDGDEYLVSVCRPALLNGIPSLLARGDLADRSLAITLPAIPDAKRRPEDAIWRDFNDAAPAVLALLLDGLVRALADLPTLRLPRLPRMADFARLACAAAPAFGWTAAEMLHAIEANRAGAVETVIEADPVGVAVRELVESVGSSGWRGTATELLGEVNARVPEIQKREKSHPKNAARFSTHLRRLAPALRRAGWDMALPETGGRSGRIITIAAVQGAEQRSERSQRSEPGGNNEGGYL